MRPAYLEYPGQKEVSFHDLDPATQEYWFPNDYQLLRNLKGTGHK
jgi:hypothetical protein